MEGKNQALEQLDDDYNRLTAKVLQRVLRADDSCVDVGAGTGLILREMLRFAPEGRHYAVEPIPHFAERLRQEFPTVEIIAAALSEKEGAAVYCFVPDAPAYSGLRERDYEGTEQRIEKLQVETKSLDSIVPPGVKIRFIKIDVEGGELQVLRGGERVIREGKPFIAFEHGKGAAEYYGTSPSDVYQLLCDEFSLSISLLSDWLTGLPPLGLPAFVDEFENERNWFFLAHPLLEAA